MQMYGLADKHIKQTDNSWTENYEKGAALACRVTFDGILTCSSSSNTAKNTADNVSN